MKYIYFLIALIVLFSCNTQKKESEQTVSQPANITKAAPIKCYQYASPADTIILKTVTIGNSITGTLVYTLKEKDNNKGTIQGTMKDNILIADYTFMSEGMWSVRQVAFQWNGNSFAEGHGEIAIKKDRAFFKDLNALKFDATRKLTETDCK